jgi:putative DNA primase/helicase
MTPSTLLETAQWLRSRGFWPLPIPFKQKGPILEGWDALRIDTPDLAEFFNGSEQNIGARTGDGVADVDLDCPEAIAAAPWLLPPTDMRHGRASARGSHWWYRSAPDLASHRLRDLADPHRPTLVELRANPRPPKRGYQTLTPPSTHPEGEPIEWEGEPGEPATVDGEVLTTAVKRIGALALLARHLPAGARHDAALALAGAALRGGMDAATLEPILAALAAACGLPERVEEFIRAGYDTAKRLAAGEHSTGAPTLATLATDGPRIVPTVLRWLAIESGPTVEGGADRTWPPRRPLPAALPDVPVLPAELLPEALRPWLADAADRLQVPLELLAIPAIVSVGALVGRAVALAPKQHDDWREVPNLWGCTIGRAGVLKSPAVREGTRFLRRLAATARKQAGQRATEAHTQCERLKLQIEQTRRRGVKATADPAAIAAEMAALKAELATAQPPPERRYYTSDSTVEKLGELLRANPRGILMLRDELAGWIRAMDRAGREGEREFYLEAWAGTGDFCFDRIARGTVYVPNLTISVLGTTQPARVQALVADAVAGAAGDDGLLQRFGLTCWPDVSETWVDVDRWPESRARERAWRIFAALDALTPEGAGASTSRDDPLPTLRFAPDAQALFTAWRTELERSLRTAAAVPCPAFDSHRAKYRGTFVALALIGYLVDLVDGGAEPGAVSLAAAQRAGAWIDFLTCHAERLYGLERDPGRRTAHLLAEQLTRGVILDGMTVRDVKHAGWSGLTSSDVIELGLQVLVEHGWVRIVTAQTAGRPRRSLLVHPDFRRGDA